MVKKYFEIRRNNESQIVAAGYHTAAYADKDYAAIEALGEILLRNPSGYLYKNLVETKKVSSFWIIFLQRSWFNVFFNFDVSKDKI